MDNVQKALVLNAAKNHPGLISVLANAIDLGEKKEAVMDRVLKITTKLSLTAATCEAICDYFLSDEGKDMLSRAKAARIAHASHCA